MEIRRSLFEYAWFEAYSSNAKILYIFLSLITEKEYEVYISRERICFETGILDLDLDLAMSELSVWFYYEDEKLKYNGRFLNKKT